MKKLLLFSMMCLMALSMQAQKNTSSKDYVDLGLPSGTLWKSSNEEGGFYTYDEAVSQFGNSLPTREQWEELRAECQWSWNGNGFKVIGPNGNSIILPALGYRKCDGSVPDKLEREEKRTYYCSQKSYCFSFFSSGVSMGQALRKCVGRSVRLVQN